jgi:hypothetical protein
MKQLNIKVKLNNNVFFKIVSFPLKHYTYTSATRNHIGKKLSKIESVNHKPVRRYVGFGSPNTSDVSTSAEKLWSSEEILRVLIT